MKSNIKKIVSIMLVFAMVLGLSTQIWAKPMGRCCMKKNHPHKLKTEVLMVIPPTDIEDLEFFVPKSILEANGAKVTVASTTKGYAKGSHGALVKPDIKISDVKVKKYDAVIVVGGMGTIAHLWDDASLRKLLIEANKKDLIIGAICGAPPALAKAGIMEGKSATMYTWDDGIKELEKYGAKYVDEDIVVSENIVTGRNVDTSEAFGLKMCEVLGILK